MSIIFMNSFHTQFHDQLNANYLLTLRNHQFIKIGAREWKRINLWCCSMTMLCVAVPCHLFESPQLTRRPRTDSMMTSSNGNISALLALCEGNSPVTGEFPSKRPVTRSFNVFFVPGLNKRLSKQLKQRWYYTPSRSIWRHHNWWKVHLHPIF